MSKHDMTPQDSFDNAIMRFMVIGAIILIVILTFVK
jgi:hypothetical protein